MPYLLINAISVACIVAALCAGLSAISTLCHTMRDVKFVMSIALFGAGSALYLNFAL